MGVDSAPSVLLLCGRSVVRMLGVVVTCGGHATSMMVNDHLFALGVA